MQIFSLVSTLGNSFYDFLKRHCGYFFHYEKNVNELNSEAEPLCTQRDDTNRRLDEERRSQRLPFQAVEVWKRDVDHVVQDIQRLTEQMSTEEHNCLMGWCPNLSWRYRVGRSAAKIMDQVKKLKNDRNELGVLLTYAAPPPDVVEIRGDTIVPNEVAATVMQQVMEALEDDDIRSIGVHGMGGIGKTTLVRDINNRMQKESTLFNKVIMVTVSQNPELKTTQDHIAERLGMSLGNSEINLRAHRLLEGLNMQDRILIIFDDVWTKLEVVKLGIPRKDEHRCCKIILTTRNRDVCRQMGVDAEFEMKPLSKQDSWVLFESKIGEVISNNPNLQPIGDDIVTECKGSPLAIVTLGSLLAKKEEQDVWKDVLRSLRSSDPTELDSIMSVVISSIKISYDYLNDERMKFCFLFCSLFPEDYDIDMWDLRIFGIGEGFLRVEGDLLEARGKLRSYIRSLKDCGLLLDGAIKYSVKMHDVVRDTARSIASKEGHGFIEKTRKGLRDWPELENEEHCKRLSLMENMNIVALPDSPKFPQLRTLFLTDCYEIEEIPDNFFLGMSTLVNLDLSGIYLETLPQAISCLTSLRTLRLEEPRYLSSLRMLKNLEILILQGMVTIPIELAELTNLKVLSLTRVHLDLIPANVLSKLHRLEELYLDTSNLWYERKRNDDSASLIEVASLNCLTVLEVNVVEEELLCPNISSRWSQLQEFKIVFGNEFYSKEYANILSLSTKLPYPVPEWLICLIRKVECLRLEWRPDLKNVLQLDTVRTLKHLEISNCSVIQHIANTEEAPLSNYALARLEVLRLVGLSSLEKICQGPLSERFVMKLKVLRIENCGKLLNALSDDHLQAFQSLEELSLKNCYAMTHVASTADESSRLERNALVSERFVMNLKVLRIENCGKLLNALSDDHLQAFQSLEELSLKNCYAMTHVASTADESSRLERNALEHLVELNLVGMPNLIRIYDGPVLEGFLKKLKRLRLSCRKLTNVFSSDLVHCIETIESIDLDGIYTVDKIFEFSSYLTFPNPLERLKYLSLEGFKTLTVVFGGPRPSRLFPNLEKFNIRNCPELVSIWSFDNNAPPERGHEVGDLCQLSNVVSNSDGPVHSGSFNRLRYLKINGCGKLRSILSLLLAQSLLLLSSLVVRDCERLEEVISNDEPMTMHHSLTTKLALKAAVFPNLKEMTISDCHKLKKLFSFSMVRHGLQNLEFIFLSSCGQLKAIIAKEDEEKEEVVPLEGLFPRLRDLSIQDLPEILGFCSWERFLGPSSLNGMMIRNCPKLGKHHSLESLQQRRMPLVLFGNTSNLSPYFPMVLVPECNLQRLQVHDFSEIRHVFWLEKRVAEAGGITSTFSQLEYLQLCKLPKLESICVGSQPLDNFFHNLRTLYVEDCNNLRYLLPLRHAQQLRNLEWLKVGSCKRLEKLISDEEETVGWTGEGDVLPRLRDLILEHLPELTSLYSGESFLQFPSLHNIKVAHCSKLKRLSLEPNTSPNLNEIYGGEKWLRRLEQEMHMEMKNHFKPLFRSMEEEEETEEEIEEETAENPE